MGPRKEKWCDKYLGIKIIGTWWLIYWNVSWGNNLENIGLPLGFWNGQLDRW